MKRRTRKTPEQPVAAKIRAYAAGYAAGGQKEHAQGMLQAADIVDKLLGGTGAMPLGAALGASDIEARVARLETAVFPNGSYEIGKVGPSSIAFTVQPARSPAILSDPPAQKHPAEDATLLKGEERILAAIVQRGKWTSNDELTAMVDLKATSLRTYLGNLRAAGYVTTNKGTHLATLSGRARSNGHAKLPVGQALYGWWLDHLGLGEKAILQYVAEHAQDEGVGVHELINESIGLKATSVRTYVGQLMRRKLLTRPGRGTVAVALILTDEASS
jgi:hypothetical protein